MNPGSNLWLVMLVALAACAGPDENKTGDAVTDKITVFEPEDLTPVPIDILVVVDVSPSMCTEHLALNHALTRMLNQLTDNTELSVRVAAITHRVADGGKFVEGASSEIPVSCVQTEVAQCVENADCEEALGGGWTCAGYGEMDPFNFNGSFNSYCGFRCKVDSQCCTQFCSPGCVENETCPAFGCGEEGTECGFVCVNSQDFQHSGCSVPPQVDDCPADIPAVLGNSDLDLLKCLLAPEVEQGFSANIEQIFKTIWLALDPAGPNGAQSQAFLRPEAYLVILVISDEDDCSIHEDFAAPNAGCSGAEEQCENAGGQCIDYQETKLCAGTIKKDYYNSCSLLGEYRGAAHHDLAYDKTQDSCSTDAECQEYWYCKESNGVHKCRPRFYSFPNPASFQSPAGAPLFSLLGVAETYQRLISLKAQAGKVFYVAITGDALATADDAAAMISQACLGQTDDPDEQALAEKLDKCVESLEMVKDDSCLCNEDPGQAQCQLFLDVKRECAWQCYLASKGHARNATLAKSSYMCTGMMGRADLGLRHIRLAKLFGDNGLAGTICTPGDFTPTMNDLRAMVEPRLTRFCLPRAPDPGEILTVVRLTHDIQGVVSGQVPLAQGPPGDGHWVLIDPAPECPDSGLAIQLNELLDSNESVRGEYGQ